jgi:outer membrane lipoprotein carrier protein
MPVLSYRRTHVPTLVVAAAAVWQALALAAPPAQADPEALARALQRKYETLRDFTADFVHTYRGGVLGKAVTERGRVLVKTPGKMRWTYEGADRKVFVSDGRKLYSYLPEDRQVYVGTVPADDRASTAALFLTGKGNLLRDYTVAAAALPRGAPAGAVALELVPRRGDPDYDSLVLVVDGSTLSWRMLIATDRQGGRSTFTFSNVQENVGLSDREFNFSIPRGVDVITDTPPRP